MTDEPPVLEARQVSVRLGTGRQAVQAVADVSLALLPGEILALAGESGSGKTTLARTLLGIQRETAGRILLHGRDVGGLDPERARKARRDIQYVHQDAAATLDPWWSVGASLHEVLALHGMRDRARREMRIADLLGLVGLDPTIGSRYAHELSGGQLRRVALARILLLEPRIVILDEPTAGLDMSVQATILTLLTELRTRLGLTYMIISHDLGLISRFCDRVAIFHHGRIVECAPASALFATPLHPYTRALLDATLSLEPGTVLDDLPPDEEVAPPGPNGCAFQPRCPHAAARCIAQAPPLEPAGPGRQSACWRWRDLEPWR